MDTTDTSGPFGTPEDARRYDVEMPARIGHYRPLQILGEGGMGVVYEAEQTEPVRRRVALKVIRMGERTAQLEARFDAERQALAVMDHPHIATVFDGGVTDDGRSYLAMELVRGMPLVAYCDIHKLSIADRLHLFASICEAVQHAHHKGVIHRDLKPGNILVSEQGGRPYPKIIDFGIAKAVGRPLTDRTLVTHHGSAVGTPAYMSPEQADGSGLDVDTRADIYSLGVILYELLTGKLPIDPTGLTAPEFMAKLVYWDADQRTPSDAFAGLDRGDAAQLASFRDTDPGSLRRTLRRDLNWIVLKALERDRNRRYQTARDLAADVRRYLSNEPVSACPPSVWYRLRKFVRRHRAAAAAGSLVTASLLLGLATTMTALHHAQRAEEVAEREAQAAQQVSNFLVSLFGQADPRSTLGEAVTAIELLNRGAQSVREQLEGQPEAQAPMLYAIGSVYEALGQYEESQRLLEEALRLGEEGLGADDPVVGRTLTMLGNILRSRGQLDRAESVLTRAAAIYADLPSLRRSQLNVANNLGLLYRETGRFEDAERLLLDAVRGFEAEYGPRDTLLANALSNLGALYISQGRLADAEMNLTRSLTIRRDRLPPNHPTLADVLNNLGVTYWYQGEYDRAAPFYQQTLDIYQETLGPDHVLTGSALNNLGETYWKTGDLTRAETLLRRALDVKIRAVGPDAYTVSGTTNALANVLRDRGIVAEADTLYGRALAIRESALGRDAPGVAEVLRERAELWRRTGRETDAAALEARADSIEAG